MKNSPLLCLFLALVFAGQLSFSQNSWKPLNGPQGITVDAIASTDDGRTFIYHQGKGIFLTSDGGDTWSPLNTGLTSINGYDCSFATGPNGKVYVVTDRKFFRLNQSGDAWEHVQITAQSFESFELVYTNPEGHVYAIRNFGDIYRSTDEGATFSLAVPDAATEGWPGNYSFNGNNNNFCEVSFGTNWSMYRFNDDGSDVTLIRNDHGVVNSMFYHPSGILFYDDDGLFRSFDKGDTWEEIEIIPGNFSQPRASAMYIYHTGELIATTSSGTYKSSDEGTTWQKMSGIIGDFRNLKYANDGNSLFFANRYCNSPKFLRSKDLGQTWDDLEGDFNFPSVSEIYKDKNKNLYANTCRHPTWEWSQDNGNTWAPFYPQGPDQPIFDIAEDPSGNLFILGQDNLWRSSDSGNTWIDISPTSQIFWFGNIHISPTGEIYLISGFESAKSSDGGNNWEPFNSPFWDTPNNFKFHPDGSIYASTSHFGEIYRTSNGGVSWDTVFHEEGLVDIHDLHINSKGYIYFFLSDFLNGTGGLYASYDNFATYNLIWDGISGSRMVSDIEGDLFIISGDGVMYSEDDGMTWEEMNQGIENYDYPSTLFIDQEQFLYLGLRDEFIHKTEEPVAESNLVIGNIWFDENGNCQKDTDETTLTNWLVQASAGGSFYHRSTGIDGSYVLSLPAGNHSLLAVLPNSLWALDCTVATDVSFPGSMDTAYVDFPISAVQLCPIMEVDASTPLLRRCFSNNYTVRYCNKGTAPADNATVDVTLDPYFIYESATAPLISQNGNVYSFAVGSVGVNDCDDFKISVKVSCDSELGQEHCVEAHAFPDSCLVDLSRSESLDCQPNIGSFDPNDKAALVEGRTESEWVKANTDIEYKIRFQNTGTDTAFTVVIQDQLSNLLDPATLRPGASSHPYQFELMETGMLRFTFHDILLPDSNINEPASHGFVKFMVSQKPDIPDGNVISNCADIFFDFNAAITTNKVELTVGEPNAVGEKGQLYQTRAIPNPFSDQTTIEIKGLDGQPLQLQLFSNTGVLLHNNKFTGPAYRLDRQDLPSGLYFYLIKKEGEVIGNGKLIVK